MKRLLLVRTDRIGDLLLTTPAIVHLRQRLPDATISFLVSPQTRELIEGHPELEEVLVLDKRGKHRGGAGTFRFVRELRKKNFDAALILHPTVRVHLSLFLAGIPKRIGYRKKMGWLLTDWLKDERHLGNQHEVDNVLDFIDRAPLERAHSHAERGSEESFPRSYHFWIASSAEADRKIAQRLDSAATESLIAIHPGASCPSKRWPLERFIEVGKRLSTQDAYRIIVVAGPQDCELGRELTSQIPQAINFSGQTNLMELASLLRRCHLLISNDSGPVHVAVACGTPVLSIFGRNQAGLSPVRWRPLGPYDRYLHKDVGCYVCLAHRCNLGFECLSAISVEEVVQAAREILCESQNKSEIKL